MKDYSDQQYIQLDPFDGDESDVRCREVRIVKTRKEQQCVTVGLVERHPIPAGSRARFESAIVEGEWSRSYLCLPCMDAWLKRIGEDPEPPQ